ncbi:acyl-CoA thioester hydrolase YciA [Buchnera aphidicola (Taiwanaphis decaspermi)]|uniref:acyl-CoA thioester hydrolase YciA n=1 Tax=Buchnera aphidicola TaxID=9 RepID=UPI0031B8158C
MSNNKYKNPKGVVVLKILSMPKNTNVNGDIFGGWIMSKMDMGGAILAKEITGNRIVTVNVESINFFKPISVGDLVTCYAKCIYIGQTSIKIDVELWIKKLCLPPIGKYYCSTTASFIYVSVNNKGKSINIPPMSII